MRLHVARKGQTVSVTPIFNVETMRLGVFRVNQNHVPGINIDSLEMNVILNRVSLMVTPSMRMLLEHVMPIIFTVQISVVMLGMVAAEEEYLLLQNQVNKTGSPNVIVHAFFLAQLLPVNN